LDIKDRQDRHELLAFIFFQKVLSAVLVQNQEEDTMEYEIQKKSTVFTDEEGVQPYSTEDIPPDREVVTTPYDAPIRTLLDEIKDKTLIVNPEFQRRSVWDITRKSKLIESLLLNIPIPVLMVQRLLSMGNKDFVLLKNFFLDNIE
jgi:hypothetical protein